MSAIDLGVLDAAEQLRRRRALVGRADRRVPAADRRAQRRRADARRRPGRDQRVGAAVSRARARAGAGGRRAARAREREDAPLLCGIPLGAQGPLRRRGAAADRVEPGARRQRRRPRRRRLGAAARARAWCCSATPTRTSSRPAGPPTRSATRGRSTASPAARAAAAPRRWRRGWSRRRSAATRADRCGSRRPAAGPARSSRPTAGSRSTESSRSRRRWITPGRWRARSPTAPRVLAALAAGGARGDAAGAAAGAGRRAAARPTGGPRPLDGLTVALTDRTAAVDVQHAVADGLERGRRGLRALGAGVVELPGAVDVRLGRPQRRSCCRGVGLPRPPRRPPTIATGRRSRSSSRPRASS